MENTEKNVFIGPVYFDAEFDYQHEIIDCVFLARLGGGIEEDNKDTEE